MPVDRKTVKRYAANAAAHILSMMEKGQVEIRGNVVRVTSLAEAKRIKIGKLHRRIWMMEANASRPNSKKHKDAVATWFKVIDEVSCITSKAACRRVAKNA